VLDQIPQQIEDLRLKLHRFSGAPELVLLEVDLEFQEFEEHYLLRST
jgi:hypothetical protein